MGVLNVTPDSFSDGGSYLDAAAAVAAGRALHAAGADVIDVGGESTRPGADRVDAAVEAARVVDVVNGLTAAGIAVSIDTTRASVAAAALDAGAQLINDVSGGLADPDMAALAAGRGCGWVLMHWRAPSDQMHKHAEYADVVAEVRAELCARVDAALEAGVAADRIVVDPGLGFAKRPEHNWALSAHLDAFTQLGYPVLFGGSRKSYLGALLADADGRSRPPVERDAATAATSLLAFQAGVWGVRVHDVRSSADARAVWAATRRAGQPGGTASPAVP